MMGFDPNAPVGADRLYTPREAAILLGMSARPLEGWRRRGDGPLRAMKLHPKGQPRYRGIDILRLVSGEAA